MVGNCGWACAPAPLPRFYTALHMYNKKNFGLYRDDGLEVAKNNSGLETEKNKEKHTKISKENKFDIVIQCNMKIVNNLDVSLNLNNSNYKPYHNPDNKIIHIHKYSLNKSLNRSKNEFPPYHPTKPYLTNQRKFIKKL